MKKLILTLATFTLFSSAFAAAIETKTAYSKASGYTGMKKSLLYQCLGNKRFRRLV